MIHSNLDINSQGHLTFAGVDTVEIAKEFGTPLYVIDEERIRKNMRTYITAMKENFGENSRPLFASKALCFKRIYEIAREEGMSTDIVSPGELYTAYKANFPMENAYFHGNNKTDADIKLAIDLGIGHFIADNREELDSINRIAAEKGIIQKVILRITPGIDPHTHAKINTGKVDSKFGTPIETGQAEELIQYALLLKNIQLTGFHCHIGSQIFDCKPFYDAADIMIAFIAHIREKFNYTAKYLNLGGGFGVRYVESDPRINIPGNIREISHHIKNSCAKFNIPQPDILMEPGRSIVADAGITLYTVGSVKTIRGYKSYVSIDGGMTDNPRYALYQSPYTVLTASKANAPADFCCTIAGRCCESGDLIQEDVAIAKPERGDILAVLVTGAYNYAMSSNYNRLGKPGILMIAEQKPYWAVKPETLEDLLRNDI